MPIRSDDQITIVPGEVRPEELSELVERLHRRHEHLTVQDVAETLGVETREIEATLAGMRAGSMHSAARARPRRKRRFGRLVLPVALLLATGIVGTISYSEGEKEGMLSAIRRARMEKAFSSGQGSVGRNSIDVGNAPSTSLDASSSVELTENLQRLLPKGMTMRVGRHTIAGLNDDGVFAQAAILDAALKLARSEMIPGSTVGRTSVQAIRAELASRTPVAVNGLSFVRIQADKGNSGFVLYLPSGPGPGISLGGQSDRLIRNGIASAEARLSDQLTGLGRPEAP